MVEVRIAQWQLSLSAVADDVAGLELVHRLDTGAREISVEVLVDGAVGSRYRLSRASAAYVQEQLRRGWRLPPAVCWYGLYGLPVLGELMGVRETFET